MTDPSRHAAPRLRLGALELRLYLVAVLASVYVLTFRAVGGGHDASTSPAAPTAPHPVTSLPPAVWLDQLPVAQRPVVVPPPGWRIASRGEAAAAAPAPVVVRAPASRPLRVRTRSS